MPQRLDVGRLCILAGACLVVVALAGLAFETAPALEKTLPLSILGRPTTLGSLVGEPATEGTYGMFPKLLAFCLGHPDADATMAAAMAPNLRCWAVEAVKVEVVSGDQLERTLLSAIPDLLREPPGVRTAAGRDYRVYGQIAVHTTEDTIYVVWQVLCLIDDYGPGITSAPTPDPDLVFADVVRQLP
jgi:hypothetical protein